MKEAAAEGWWHDGDANYMPLAGSGGGPVNGLHRTSIRLAEQPVHTYTLALPAGGSINNSLAEPSISPRRYDEAVDRPRDYTRS